MNNWRWTYSPFSDRAVTAFAIRALREETLGQRGHLDYLGVSLSAPDLVGHYYGQLSREQLDNLLRLDEELDRLFSALDEEVGRGRWVLAMSADHGVLDIPELLVEDGVDADRLDRGDRADLLAALEGASFLAGDSREAAKEAVLELPSAQAAYTFDEIEAGTAVDSFAVLYRNSHSDERIVHLESRSGVYARLLPNRLEWGVPAASHGSPYYYDRHVPLIFLGAGVRTGSSAEPVATVDAAPTLARLGGIPAPACARDFDVIASVLADVGYRVVCPDVVGRGDSDWLADPEGYVLRQYVADMGLLLDHLGLTEVDWLGTSMGGLIGMALAARPGTPVRRLVLNDIGPFVPTAALQRLGTYVGADPRFDDLAAAEAHLRITRATFGRLTDEQWRATVLEFDSCGHNPPLLDRAHIDPVVAWLGPATEG